MAENLLYYGDNLDVLRRHVKDESVDLIYLDPPFNSNATYNALFGEQDGTRSAAQIKAMSRFPLKVNGELASSLTQGAPPGQAGLGEKGNAVRERG
jgi:hypothetical protein